MVFAGANFEMFIRNKNCVVNQPAKFKKKQENGPETKKDQEMVSSQDFVKTSPNHWSTVARAWQCVAL